MIVKTKQEEFQSYLKDAGNNAGRCESIAFPENADDVVALMRSSFTSGTPLTISGNGTGLTGGRCPNGGMMVATDKLQSILEINTTEQYALVEVGVTLERLQHELQSCGYFFPPDPTEPLCFIGGIIANNASGAKSFAYGAVRNFVQALQVVLPNGKLVWIERGKHFTNGLHGDLSFIGLPDLTLPNYHMPAVKNAAGYFVHPDMDIIDLWIGSEGTLGIVCAAKLKIIPLPEKVISCVAFFPTEDSALDFIDAARNDAKTGTRKGARALEFFDEHSLAFLRADFHNIPPAAKAAVWFEQECRAAEEELLLNDWLLRLQQFAVDEEHLWYAADAKDAVAIQNFRHAISYKINEVMAARGLRKLGTDTAVPVAAFRKFFNDIKAMVADKGVAFVAYGHFGDCHVHLNMMPASTEEFDTAKAIYQDICALAIGFGGTVSAEHGIGKTKREFLTLMYGRENVAEMQRVKRHFDPADLLNRGNLFF